MVGRKDKSPITVKIKVGLNSDYQPFYSDWQVVYMKEISHTGSYIQKVYGDEYNFDKVIQLECNDITRQIDEFTLFCVDVMPYNNYNEYGDYIVKKRLKEKNGIIVLGLERRQSASIPKLYYLLNGTVLQFDIDYDATNMTAYLKQGEYNPFTEDTIIWSEEPTSTTDLNNRIRLLSTQSVGVDDYFSPFIELYFGEINE